MIDHYQDDLVQSVRDLTYGRGVDVVVEHVGAATWDRSVRCLARGAIRPVVDSTFPLSETAQAHRRMEVSDQFGKIVLVM